MCEALEKLMQKEIDEKVSEGKAVGIAEGKAAGKLAALTELVRDGILTVSDAAKRANMTEAVFIENMKKFKA